MRSDFYEFAEGFRVEAESTIKAELSRRSFLERGIFGLFMPLIVNINTDQGSISISFFKDGSVQSERSLSSNPDVIIQADFETLKKLYFSRDKNQFIQAEREGKIRITSSNLKGKQAERKIRELLYC